MHVDPNTEAWVHNEQLEDMNVGQNRLNSGGPTVRRPRNGSKEGIFLVRWSMDKIANANTEAFWPNLTDIDRILRPRVGIGSSTRFWNAWMVEGI